MYTDFHDQNHNSLSPSVVMPAVKNHIIRHSGGFELFRPNGQTPFAYFGEDDYIRESFVLTNSCGSDGIKLGSVNIGMMKVTVKNENVARIQSPDMLIDCVAYVSFNLTVDDNTTADVRYGAYFVKEVEQLTEGVKLTCYDGMCKLDAPFSGALSGTPYQILTAAATACGVRVQSTQAEIEALPNGTKTFTLHEDNDCKTWRDVLAYLTALMGCFVTFGRLTYGAMTLPGIEVRPFGGGASSFCDTITDTQRYTGAKFSLWDTAYAEFTLKAYALEDPNDPDSAKKQDFTYTDTTISTEGQTIDLGYNPFLQATTPEAGLTQDQIAILHDLLEKVATYQYTPLQITLPVGFIYDLGDVLKCTGRLANTGFAGGPVDDAYGVILNETYTYGRDYRIKSLDSHAGKGRTIIPPTPPVIPQIFGVEGDLSSSATLTRTDDAADFTNPVVYTAGATTYGSPFDNVMPWSGMERVSNAEAGELVKIPKFWFKLGSLGAAGTNFKLQIANYAAEGFSVAPAFIDRGDGKGERDFVYVGRYLCSSANYKSTSGVSAKTYIKISTARSNISALGSDVWQWDFAMLVTIQMLYLVEYATFGGSRFGVGTSTTPSCGGTDSMPYHTGTVGASWNRNGDCQYRHIENLNGYCASWVDGIYFDFISIYLITNPANFSNTTGGTLVGTRDAVTSAFIKNFIQGGNAFSWFFYPFNAVAPPPPVYIGRISYSRTSTALNCGIDGTLFSYYPAGEGGSGSNIGARLMVLP